MRKNSITHIFAMGLLIALTFSCHSLNGMQALRKKQLEVAEEEQIRQAIEQSLNEKSERILGLLPGIYEQKNSLEMPFVQLVLEDTDRQKDGTTCGIRATIFAKALDMLTAKNIDITPKTLHIELVSLGYQQTVDEYKARGLELESTAFQPIMEKDNKKLEPARWFLLGIQDNQIISLGKNEEEETNFKTLEALTKHVIAEELQKLFTGHAIKTPIHFICSEASTIQGGSKHWILFSAIYYKGSNTVWYIDPLNGDFKHGSWGAPLFANFIVSRVPNPSIPK